MVMPLLPMLVFGYAGIVIDIAAAGDGYVGYVGVVHLLRLLRVLLSLLVLLMLLSVMMLLLVSLVMMLSVLRWYVVSDGGGVCEVGVTIGVGDSCDVTVVCGVCVGVVVFVGGVCAGV